MLSTVSWVAPTVEPLGKTTLDVILVVGTFGKACVPVR
jgi:hypothetical protein